MASPKVLIVLKRQFAPIFETTAGLLYDSRKTIRYVSPLFCKVTGFAAEEAVGCPVSGFIFKREIDAAIDMEHIFNYDRQLPAHVYLLVMRLKNYYKFTSYRQIALENAKGFCVRAAFYRPHPNYVLVLLHRLRATTLQAIGELSSDMYVAVNSRNRIISFSERFIKHTGQPPTRIFGKTLDAFLEKSNYALNISGKNKIQSEIRARAKANRHPWQTVYESDFNRPDWRSKWTVEDTFAGRVKEHALFISGKHADNFMIFNRPFDHQEYDLRWDAEVDAQSAISVAFFFFGSDDCLDSRITTPDFEGHTVCFHQHPEITPTGLFILKRWNVDLLRKKSFLRRIQGSRMRLTCQFCGGLFTISLNNKVALTHADPFHHTYGTGRHTGLIFSNAAVVLRALRLSVRPGSGRAVLVGPQCDFIFRNHPTQVYEGHFFDRSVDAKKFTQIYFRRVTELRQTERENARLYREKEAALDQAETRLNQLNRELKMAASVLDSLIPKHFPVLPHARFYSYFKPSHHVGGDLFDVFSVDNDHIALFMHDVCGHGVPAALISVMVRTLFQKHFASDKTLVELLSNINHDLQTLQYDNDAYRYVTLFCGVLNHRTGGLRYIGAAFPAPILVEQTNLVLLETRGIPLGLMNQPLNAEEHMVSLGTAGKLLIFTDGLYELLSPEGAFYRRSHFEEIIQTLSHRPLKQIFDAILNEHQRILGPGEPQDDVTLLGVELGEASA